MRPVRTLVVVASEGAFRLLANEGVGKGLTEVAHVGADAFPDVATAYSDRPGRSSAGPGPMALHGLDPHQSVREQRRARLAAHLARAVEDAWDSGDYDRVVLAAPPKLLGLLRAELAPRVAGHVSGELAKDLVKIPPTELPAHFADVAAF